MRIENASQGLRVGDGDWGDARHPELSINQNQFRAPLLLIRLANGVVTVLRLHAGYRLSLVHLHYGDPNGQQPLGTPLRDATPDVPSEGALYFSSINI